MNQSAPAYNEHNNQNCIEQTLATAKALCSSRGVDFTSLRERVFILLWHSNTPLGADTILSQLAEQDKTWRLAPPTVYRGLEFLQKQGLVHRIASLNTFIGCNHPQYQHDCQFLICKLCDITLELNNQAVQISKLKEAEAAGFIAESARVQILGLCPNYQLRSNKQCAIL